MSNVFTFPGEYARELLTQHTPGLASLLGVSRAEESIIFTIVLSLVAWILACVLLWGLVRLVQNIYRIAGAMLLTFWYRLTQGAGSIKTRVVCQFRRLIPMRQTVSREPLPEVQFDDIDLTVLQAAGERGAGFTTSAPELASKFGLRPAQFQNSLRKLQSSKMIDTVLGSTDGFDNYRLTDYGASYMRMWEQRQAS
jgi:hypothetical protein